MHFVAAFYEPEVSAELYVKCFGRISRHIETTASQRAVLGKCCHEHEPSWPNRPTDLFDVTGALRRAGEKMKYGAVMPHIKRTGIQIGRQHIGLLPYHRTCIVREALLRLDQCSR